MSITPDNPTSEPALREVEALEQLEADLLTRGRAIFGVTGAFEFGSLGHALRASGLRLRSAVGLAVIGAAALLPLTAVWLLADAIGRSFGGYSAQLELIVVVAFVAGAAVGVRSADRLPRRAPLVAGLVGGAAVVFAAFGTFYGLLWWLVVAAVAGGMTQVQVVPSLYDAYPPEVRGRVTAIHAGGIVAAFAATTGARAAVDTFGLSWRVALVGLGLASLAGCAALPPASARRVGAWDECLLADEAHRAEGGLVEQAEAAGRIETSVAERLRRVLVAPTSTPLLLVAFVFGLFAVPVQRYTSIFLRDGFGVPSVTWYRLSALSWLGGLAGLAFIARRAEIAYRVSPARLLQLVSWLGSLAAAALAVVAVSGNRVLAVLVLAVAAGAVAASLACAVFAVVSLTQSTRRAHAAVLVTVALILGAQFGTFVLDTIGSRFGAAWGLVTAAVVVLTVARRVNAALPAADSQLDAVVTSIVEEESLRAVMSHGKHVPLLACRGVDFSYGQLQVLFGVDFTVDDGEMVALLGTNGAGKSTLLRVISGLGLPAAGSVRFRGADISYVGTDRRVQLGISQIPGGKAVFGPMTVAENLAVYGYTHGRDKAAVTRGVDATFEAFPRLAERRNQLASTLSGGEQQMLALGKAFVLSPRLLLIDELSLGLAPIIVSDLLKMVRQINREGTAVVLVEQSVNVALSLVHHAYFMEKGSIRFDGPAAELIDRPDLLRSVFLEGVATAVAERVS